MRKWIVLLLSLSLPAFGANLKGTVTDHDGKGLNGARVVIMHDLALFLVHNGHTDRNGQYQFKLDPGPYRVVVLQRGFQPTNDSILIVSEREQVMLEHSLEPLNKSGAQAQAKKEGNSKTLKDYYRKSNMKPQHSLRATIARTSALQRQELDRFSGYVKTASRNDLAGGMGRTSSVGVNADLSQGLQLSSRLTNEKGASTYTEAMHIDAGLAMKWHNMALGVRAESIQRPDSLTDGTSRVAEVSGSYERDMTLATRLRYSQSRDQHLDQEEITLSQDLGYEINNHRLSHEAELSTWQSDEISFAKRAQLNTSWQHGESRKLILSSDLDYLDLETDAPMSTKLWLGTAHENLFRHWNLEANLGYHHGDHGREVVQNHRIAAVFGALDVEAGYEHDSRFKSFASRDVFGSYLTTERLTPYAHESFYQNTRSEMRFNFGLDHGNRWHSKLSWNHSDEAAERLYAHAMNRFKSEAEQEQNTYAYTLQARRYGASFQLGYSENTNGELGYDQTEVAYLQSLNPFRNKAMGIQLELRMYSNPNIPAWWLLEQMPWDVTDDDNWYEGHVSVQF